MLDTPIDEVVYEKGVAVGVRSGEEVAKAKIIIGDPSYFPGKIRRVGKVIRAICLLQHPIPNTDNTDSVQLIIPQNQVARRHGLLPVSPLAIIADLFFLFRHLYCGSILSA
jgi:Rab GDP dissociation inhibitor